MALTHSQFALALIALQLPDLPGLTLARRLRHAPPPTGSMPIILFGDAWDPDRIIEGCREAQDRRLPTQADLDRTLGVLNSRSRPSPERGTRSTAAHVATPAPLDFDRLSSFTDGDAQLERELTSLYLSTAAIYVGQMRAAIAGGNGWSRAAHALKGASANIGATEVARIAEDAEGSPASAERLRAARRGPGRSAGAAPATALVRGAIEAHCDGRQ